MKTLSVITLLILLAIDYGIINNMCGDTNHLTLDDVISKLIPAIENYEKNEANLSANPSTLDSAKTHKRIAISSSAIAGLIFTGSVSSAHAIIPTGSATVVGINKTVLTILVMASLTATGGGILMSDGLFTDPYIEYSLYPAQLPAALHGTSLVINNVYSSEDKSKTLNYHCDADPIIRGLDYSFDCIIENKETVTVNVQIDAPRNLLDADAMDCISQHDTLSENITVEYSYLLNLPELSPSRTVNLKNSHIEMMDDYFENRDYASAKKHAMIVLKYFNGNDIQTLSTLGNTMRDENRQEPAGTHCAMIIHSTPFMANTAWGTLSLAEDNHVLGNFQKASELASRVIDDYYPDSIYIEETTYKNALIVKANALFRIAMTQQAEDIEDVRKYYTMAHEIEPSYDSWFGLGNLDRYVSDFDQALEKYKEAKKLTRDTTEIDYEMNVMRSYL